MNWSENLACSGPNLYDGDSDMLPTLEHIINGPLLSIHDSDTWTRLAGRDDPQQMLHKERLKENDLRLPISFPSIYRSERLQSFIASF